MHNAHYTTSSMIPCAMCDLAWDREDTINILDAVEDAKDGKDLVKRLNALNLRVRWTLDRETDKSVRLRGKEPMENTRFFFANK